MNKKFISVLCASALLLSSVACGCSSNDSASGGDNTQNGSGTAASSDNTGSADGADQAVSDSINTQKTCVFTVNGQKVYNSGRALYIIKDDDIFEYAEQQKDENSNDNKATMPKTVNIPPQYPIIGNDSYGFYLDSGQCGHWDLIDLYEVKQDVIYEGEDQASIIETALKKAEPEYDDTVSLCSDIFNLCSKLVDGGDGYIYGVILCSKQCSLYLH